jgi:hypothetical protein
LNKGKKMTNGITIAWPLSFSATHLYPTSLHPTKTSPISLMIFDEAAMSQEWVEQELAGGFIGNEETGDNFKRGRSQLASLSPTAARSILSIPPDQAGITTIYASNVEYKRALFAARNAYHHAFV